MEVQIVKSRRKTISIQIKNSETVIVRAPIEIMDYVVVHEPCHRLYLNHSKEFWKEVERVLPDYRVREKWLKENGTKLMAEVQSII